MAYRRNSRDLISSLLQDHTDDDDIEACPLGVIHHPKYHTRKPHTASTNFSLDTLADYLQKELEDQLFEEQRLKTDRQYALVEAEKSRLRRLVNSHKPIDATVRNGRLEVRHANNTSRRSLSAPASEGDNEAGPSRARTGSSSGMNNNSVLKLVKAWNVRKRKSWSAQKDLSNAENSREGSGGGLVSSLPTPVATNEPKNNSVLLQGSFRSQLGNPLGKDARRISSEHKAGVTGLENATTARSRFSEKFVLDSDSGDSIYFDPLPMSADREQEASSSRTNYLQDWPVQEGANTSVNRDRKRSLSFEKHADQVRNEIRASKGKEKERISEDENQIPLQDRESPRIRKAAGNRLHSISNLAVPSPEITSSLRFPGGDSFRAQTIIEGHSHHVSTDGQNAMEVESHHPNHNGMDDGNIDHLAETFSLSSDNDDVNNDAPDAPTAGRKKRRDKDTFYSASSDDSVSVENESDFIISENLQECQGINLAECDNQRRTAFKDRLITKFDYGQIVPESIPPNIVQAKENCRKIWSLVGLNSRGQPDNDKSVSWYRTQYAIDELNPNSQNILGAADTSGQYTRKWKACTVPVALKDPPACPSSSQREGFPLQALRLVCNYLSSRDIRNLRLVNRDTASAVLPEMIRSTVIRFGNVLFDATDGTNWDQRSDTPAASSLLQSFGGEISRFGISFDFDEVGFANAEPKAIEKEVNAWFGKYHWPKETYPRFAQLKDLEDLVDSNRPLLRNTMKSLTNVSELALSIDSGHGWLEGPDMSDMALLRRRRDGGPKILGKRSDVPDRWHEFALREFISWGQQNTINAYAKHAAGKRSGQTKADRMFLRRVRVRNYDDYLIQGDQPDFNRAAHTGGTAAPPVQQQAGAPTALPPLGAPPALPIVGPVQASAALAQMPTGNANALPPNNVGVNTSVNAVVAAMGGPGNMPAGYLPPLLPLAAPLLPGQPGALVPLNRSVRVRQQRRQTREEALPGTPILPQWPLIFNGFNLASQVCGDQAFVQDEIPLPSNFAYLPGELNETQVQWLMETLWAQRTFLSAYTNSVISNAPVFRKVHTLNIAQLSSSLISSLAQREFWSSLPNLKTLTLKIKPDWRQEHVLGDRYFYRNMAISPLQASLKLANLLETFVANIENLSALRTGFVGGGEHQPGIFGRNRHVLPAPISNDPFAWLTRRENKANPRTMLVFNHIRELTFENCWFSPYMLEAFMEKSKDTSLHELTLDSVSVTGYHDTRNDGPLSTEGHNLRCQFSPSEWLQESVPLGASWVNVLDKITPGKTILDRKFDANMIDEGTTARPLRSFRGNIRKIRLNSCGYVRLIGVKSEQFCQNGLVEQSKPWHSMDDGLELRKRLFYSNKYLETSTQSSSSDRPSGRHLRRQLSDDSKDAPKLCIMMSTKDPETRSEYPGLGKLTQCIHPVEKRVLERAWGLRFGWGDTMERWAAVEDGWYEGGTGRFSGIISKADDYDNDDNEI